MTQLVYFFWDEAQKLFFPSSQHSGFIFSGDGKLLDEKTILGNGKQSSCPLWLFIWSF
jgi:hypothetical protein